MNEMIKQLSNLIRQSSSTVFFGGAGVSTESGIPDFRSESGLFTAQSVYGRSPEELLSRHLFDKNCTLFFRYYRENLIARNAKPNAAHIALAKLESMGLLRAVVTQNIDGLHQAAGSRNVFELHGSNEKQYCISCGTKHSLDYILNDDNCKCGIIPLCEKCGGIVRPDVVMYQEPLSEEVFEGAAHAVETSELFIVGGTSLVVHPAASLIRYFKGKHLVLINKSETPYDKDAHLVINDSIGKVLEEAVILATDTEGGNVDA